MTSTGFLLLVALVAPVELDFRLLPPGHNTVLPGVGQVRYYPLEEYLQLADYDYELYLLRQNAQDAKDHRDALRLRGVLLEDQIKTLSSDVKILTNRCERLQTSWDECESSLGGCETSWWPWLIAAAGVGVGLTGVGIAVAASFNML